VLTGSYPYRNGIIANEWTDRNTLQQVYCTGDPAHVYIGEETGKLDGTSPANLWVSTLGDELRYATGGQAKVIAVSGKDRGAILLAGKRGTAYMYMGKTGRFASSTYYMQTHPEWHTRYYTDRPQDKWFAHTWTLSQPEAVYARSSTDNSPWFRNFFGMGQAFPFKPGRGTAPDALYYEALMRTPFGDEATLDFARAAMEGEQLGRMCSASASPRTTISIMVSGRKAASHRIICCGLIAHSRLFFSTLIARLDCVTWQSY
jgi:hypothetical protein